MKTGAQRAARYLAKTEPGTVSLKVASMLPGMKTRFASATSDLVAMETAVQGLLNHAALPTIQYPFYLNFGRELFKRVWEGINGPALALLAQSLSSSYKNRGLIEPTLQKIAFLSFGLWIPTPPIPVGSHPVGLCYNATNNKVYCANLDGYTVTVIDGATDLVITTIPAGSWINALCYNPTNNKVYCANSDDDNVTVIDGATDSVIATVAVGSNPTALCYNPTYNKVYCPNFGSDNVTVIDGATNAVLATVTVGTQPYDLCYNPTNNKVYCANIGSDNVILIDGALDKI